MVYKAFTYLFLKQQSLHVRAHGMLGRVMVE